MPGSFTINPSSNPPPLRRNGRLCATFLVDDDSGDLSLLSNVRCLGVSPPGEGPETGSARFRYAFGDPFGSQGDPQRVEEVYPLDADGPGVIEPDAHICVRAYRDDGSFEYLFDGFASIPQADLSDRTEMVTFEAFGTPVRELDFKLEGQTIRPGDALDTPNQDAPAICEFARFNPLGRPNATPDDPAHPGQFNWDSGTQPNRYPVFAGPNWPSNQLDGKDLRLWTVGMAARYILAVGCDQNYVQLDSLEKLEDLLQTIKPTQDDGEIDMGDSSTYTKEPIIVQDLDVTGDPWPVALFKLIDPHGFAMRFYLTADQDNDPQWRLNIYRKDDLNRVKSLYMQAPGDPLDPGQTNTLSIRLARDTRDISNEIVLDTHPVEVEAGLILNPLFQVSPGDTTNFDQFKVGNSTFSAANYEKYRNYGIDECGEGFFDPVANNWVTGQAFDWKALLELDDVLPDDWDQRVKDAAKADPPQTLQPWVKRLRPARPNLIKREQDGKPRPARLYVCPDYPRSQPEVWDGAASLNSFREVPDGLWTLLPDRLGIRFTGRDPNAIALGSLQSGATDPFNGQLNLVEMYHDWISGTNNFPHPTFMLVCVVEADQDIGIFSPRRDVSPTGFVIERRRDESRRYRKRIISRYSYFADPANQGKNGKDVADLDDTDDAQADADGIRRAHETGSFAGTVTLMGIRTSYQVGDKIDKLVGRNIDFRQNLGANQDESPVYPTVVSVEWQLDGEQKTVLQLQDRRAEPPPKHRESHED